MEAIVHLIAHHLDDKNFSILMRCNRAIYKSLNQELVWRLRFNYLKREDLCLKKEPSLTWKEWYLFWRKHQEDLLFTDFLNFNPQQAYYCIISREIYQRNGYLFHTYNITLKQVFALNNNELTNLHLERLDKIFRRTKEGDIPFFDILSVIKILLRNGYFMLAKKLYHRYEALIPGLTIIFYLAKYGYSLEQYYDFTSDHQLTDVGHKRYRQGKKVCEGKYCLMINLLKKKDNQEEAYRYYLDHQDNNAKLLDCFLRRIYHRNFLLKLQEKYERWYDYVDYKRCSDETFLACFNKKLDINFITMIVFYGRHTFFSKLDLKQKKYKIIVEELYRHSICSHYRDLSLYFAVLLVKYHKTSLKIEEDLIIAHPEMQQLLKNFRNIDITKDYFSLLERNLDE